MGYSLFRLIEIPLENRAFSNAIKLKIDGEIGRVAWLRTKWIIKED